MVCRGLLLMLHRVGEIELPAIRLRPPNPLAQREQPQAMPIDTTPLLGDASRERILRTLRAAKIGQPAQPLIIDAGLDRGLPSTLGTTAFVESFLYGI
jgi:hypothetical protein